MIPGSPFNRHRRALAVLGSLVLALACKAGAGEDTDDSNTAGTETNASGTTVETSTVTGVVADDAAFAPGTPSVPVAGTNLWLSADGKLAVPKVYALGSDGAWSYFGDATTSGAEFTARPSRRLRHDRDSQACGDKCRHRPERLRRQSSSTGLRP